jgi:hypothetical protein
MKKIFLLTIVLAGSLFSATFNVSTTPELRTALSTAATNGEDDTIILADGTYKTTDDGQGTFIYLSNEANSLTLQGSSADNVILSGDSTHQILNHQSTENAHMTLKKLSFIDGNNTSGDGGGVYTDYSIEVIYCDFNNNKAIGNGGGFYSIKLASVQNTLFTNNISYSTSYGGGGFYSDYAIVKDSSFIGNSAGSYGGGGFYLYGYNNSSSIENTKFINNVAATGAGFYAHYKGVSYVYNCTFLNNNASISGGGFYSDWYSTSIVNSIFTNNSAEYGAGIYVSSNSSDHSMTIVNSIFTKNNASISGGGIYSERASTISNSIFKDNSNGIYILSGEKHNIYNNIFSNNTSDIDGSSEVIISKLKNNYIDVSKLTTTNFPSNNVYNGINLGFSDEENADYRLTSSSNIIDIGYYDNSIFFPNELWDDNAENMLSVGEDLDGNKRIVGGSIDIGPYEFTSTKPTIDLITYTGNTQELNQLTFNTNYTLTNGRYINSVSYDFENTGTWTTSNTHTFNSAGTYTVKVKITDSEGEFSIQSKEITITQLDFVNMTNEQKLIKAINPSYYDEIIAIINSNEATSTTSGISIGENNVVSNPSSYNLITKTQSDSLVSLSQTAAYNDGVTTGKAYVQDNLTEFNLVTKTASDTAIASATTTGITTGEANVKANPSTFGLITLADKDSAVSSALEQGKQLVLSNPSSFGLELKEPLTKAKIDALSTGWHNISSPSEITDLSIFDNASIVWIFNSTSNSWEAYSSNSTYKTQIENDTDTKLATKVNAGVGIWVLK